MPPRFPDTIIQADLVYDIDRDGKPDVM